MRFEHVFASIPSLNANDLSAQDAIFHTAAVLAEILRRDPRPPPTATTTIDT